MTATRNGADHAFHHLDQMARTLTAGENAAKAVHLRENSRSTAETVRDETGAAHVTPDHEGTITRAEFTRLLIALGQPATAADAAFTSLDRDHDNRITRAEYVAAWEDYLLSDTPDTTWALAFTGL